MYISKTILVLEQNYMLDHGSRARARAIGFPLESMGEPIGAMERLKNQIEPVPVGQVRYRRELSGRCG